MRGWIDEKKVFEVGCGEGPVVLKIDVYLCIVPADMRRSFDGLMRMATEHIERDPLRGGLYVFINKRRDRAKLMYWDGDGLAIWYKRLEEGVFHLPMVEDDVTSVVLSGTDMTLLLRRLYGPRAERIDPDQMSLFELANTAAARRSRARDNVEYQKGFFTHFSG